MKKLLYFIITLVFVSCGNSNLKEDSSYKINYEIINEKPNKAFGNAVLLVQLNQKEDESKLKRLALDLRSDRTEYNKLWIQFYLPETNTNSVAWATASFTPDFNFEINGSTMQEEKTALNKISVSGEILGKWISESSLMGGILVLHKDSTGTLLITTSFTDGSSMTNIVTESYMNNHHRYTDGNKHGEYYILESNGNLGMYGNDGKFDEAIKVKD